MWRDYIGLVPVGIAVLNSVLAGAVAQFPLATTRRKVGFIAIIGCLGVIAIAADIWSYNITTSQKAAEEVRRATIREKLGMFIGEGMQLQKQCEIYGQPPPDAAVSDWVNRVEGYLMDNMGPSYVIRFRNSSGLQTVVLEAGSDQQKTLWRAVNDRLARLNQFTEEVLR